MWWWEVQGLIAAPSCKTALCNRFTFVLRCLLNIHRGHWVKMNLQENTGKFSDTFLFSFSLYLIDDSDTSLRVPTNHFSFLNFAFFLSEECHCFHKVLLQVCPCPPEPKDSSDKAVILLNNAKFVQASSGPHAVCLATEGGIFHSVPSHRRGQLSSRLVL